MLTILILISAYFVIKAIIRAVGQYKHLTDEDVRDIMLNRIDRNSSDYGRLIRHLGICEECQNRLHNYEDGDHLEEHLVE